MGSMAEDSTPGPPDAERRGQARDGRDVLASRLGYLLKHAQRRLAEESARALAPFGVDGRRLAVLAVLAAGRPLSQIEAAGRLGLDRTTMVSFVDELEAKGLVERRRSAEDRRRNTLHLTPAGEDLFRSAEAVRRDTEARLLAPLAPEDIAPLLRALRVLATEPGGPQDPATDRFPRDTRA